MQQEFRTLVMYDIENDRVRYRVSEVCLDFGLERIQFSVFRGKLNRNKREELLMRLTDILGDEIGKILIQPMCEEDFQAALELRVGGPSDRPIKEAALGARSATNKKRHTASGPDGGPDAKLTRL